MVRIFLIFITSFIITFTCLLYAEGAPPVPELNQLIKPPQVIKYQQKPHAVFDYGGLFFLFEVTKKPIPFPQCNAVRTINNELMIVGGNPNGYVFFTRTYPIAFKTDHNPLWDELVKKSCVGKGCE